MKADKIVNNEELKASASVFKSENVDGVNPVKKFFMRLGRKLTFWYVQPFGERQNSFNKLTARAVEQLTAAESDLDDQLAADREELHKEIAAERTFAAANLNKLKGSISGLEKRIMQLESHLASEVEQLKISDSAVEAAAINRSNENVSEFNEYIRRVDPDKRRNAAYSECFDISREFANSAADELVRQPEEKVNLESWGREYRNSVMHQIGNMEREATKKIIAVICKRFKISQGIEAVRSEALELYRLLKRASVYNIRFISIEPDIVEVSQQDEITFIPEKGAGSYIASIDPVLCVFCESSPHILLSDNCSMLLNRAVLKLSAQNPIQELTANTIKELNHLNDFGVHKYLVQSKRAAQTLIDNGFREPVVSYPLISQGKIYLRKRSYNRDNFTIGFASSPMDDKQSEARGIDLLCCVIERNPSVSFVILWRYESAAVPEIMKNSANCRIEYGKVDMTEFYSSVDCVIVPYKSFDYNHACSLSAIEAMQNGIPVISTDVSGVSEVVEQCGLGEVVPADCEAISAAIIKIADDYKTYSSDRCRQRLEKILDNTNIVDLIEHEADRPLSAKAVTLYEWDRRLKLNNKYLVKGHQAMKEYYQQQEIADKYTEVRFTSKALKYFDFIERQNIGVIISSCFADRKPKILDVACGDGRITSECIKYGECTSIDASPAMLDIVRSRFEKEENKPKLQICDVISDTLGGSFDVITCFRYIRHFEYETRKLIYKKFRDCLCDHGIMILDVPNIDFELRLKEITGWQNYNIYDVFWTKESILEELSCSGFKVKYIIPTGGGLMTNLPADVRKMPMTWTIAAEKA